MMSECQVGVSAEAERKVHSDTDTSLLQNAMGPVLILYFVCEMFITHTVSHNYCQFRCSGALSLALI